MARSARTGKGGGFLLAKSHAREGRGCERWAHRKSMYFLLSGMNGLRSGMGREVKSMRNYGDELRCGGEIGFLTVRCNFLYFKMSPFPYLVSRFSFSTLLLHYESKDDRSHFQMRFTPFHCNEHCKLNPRCLQDSPHYYEKHCSNKVKKHRLAKRLEQMEVNKR